MTGEEARREKTVGERSSQDAAILVIVIQEPFEVSHSRNTQTFFFQMDKMEMNDTIYQTRPLIGGPPSSGSRMSLRSRASSYINQPIRLIDRNAAFKQSRGNIKIKRDNIKSSLYCADPVHSLLHFDTWKLIMLMLLLYILIIFRLWNTVFQRFERVWTIHEVVA